MNWNNFSAEDWNDFTGDDWYGFLTYVPLFVVIEETEIFTPTISTVVFQQTDAVELYRGIEAQEVNR